MRKMTSAPFLPEASGTKDFIVLGSEGGFIMMLAAVGALAIAAVIVIILVIRKN